MCSPSDRQIRHRACALKDTVHAIIRDELDEDFEKICEEIKVSRSSRGERFVFVFLNTSYQRVSLGCCPSFCKDNVETISDHLFLPISSDFS